jgi:hypothetical protein
MDDLIVRPANAGEIHTLTEELATLSEGLATSLAKPSLLLEIAQWAAGLAKVSERLHALVPEFEDQATIVVDLCKRRVMQLALPEAPNDASELDAPPDNLCGLCGMRRAAPGMTACSTCA